MQLRQLEYFVAVAELLNFRKAAESLYVTQPLLSKQIAELEDEVGCPLLIRNTRSVALTPAGEAMLLEARSLLRHAGTVISVVRRAATSSGVSGTLRIGHEEAFDRMFISNALSSLRSLYPAIEPRLARAHVDRIRSDLRSDDLDLGLVTLPDKHLDGDFNYRFLCNDTLTLVASSAAISGSNRMEEYIELANRTSVFLLENSTKGVSNISLLLNCLGISTTYVFAESLQNMAMHVESGAGVSVLPQSFVHTYQSPLLSCYPLQMEEAKLCMAAIWKKGTVCAARDLFLDEFFPMQNSCALCKKSWCWAKRSSDSENETSLTR